MGEMKLAMADIRGSCDVLFCSEDPKSHWRIWVTSSRTKGTVTSVTLAPFTWINERRKQRVAD